jgi:hypothetical protein
MHCFFFSFFFLFALVVLFVCTTQARSGESNGASGCGKGEHGIIFLATGDLDAHYAP